MPTLGHFPLRSADAPIEHDWCRATDLCRRCGASVKAVEQAVRALYCEPGVTGISRARRAERIRDLMWPWGGLHDVRLVFDILFEDRREVRRPEGVDDHATGVA